MSDFEQRLAAVEGRLDPEFQTSSGRIIRLSEVSLEVERLKLRVTALKNALNDAGIPIPPDAQELADQAAAEHRAALHR